MQALIARDIIGDFRAPHFIRLLYLRHVEVWGAVEALRDIMATRAYASPAFAHRQSATRFS